MSMESIMNTLDHIDKILNKRCLWVVSTLNAYQTTIWHIVKYEHKNKPTSENSIYESEYLSKIDTFLDGYCQAVGDLKDNRV
jgi:hypothetical protein